MNYKHILLVALLSCTVITYGKSNQAHINELKEAQFQKQLELSSLGKMIAERDEFLRGLKETMLSIKYNKIAALEAEKGEPLSSAETAKIGKDLQASLNSFMDLFEAADVADIKSLLERELFDQENFDPMPSFRSISFAALTSFKSINFAALRGSAEYLLLLNLVKKYAVCAQELIEIESTLKAAESV